MAGKPHIYFNKCNEKAIIPSRRAGDVGYDLYALEEDIVLEAHEVRKFDTGLRAIIDPGYAVIFKDRSSLGSKGIRVGAGVVDSSYRGNWIVALINENDLPFVFPKGKAIAQFIIVEDLDSQIHEISADEFEKNTTERGTGGFGSSGK